jgi:hypothetical protein
MTYAPMQVICSYRDNLVFPLQVSCDKYQEVLTAHRMTAREMAKFSKLRALKWWLEHVDLDDTVVVSGYFKNSYDVNIARKEQDRIRNYISKRISKLDTHRKEVEG